MIVRPGRVRKHRIPKGFFADDKQPSSEDAAAGRRRRAWRIAAAGAVALGAHGLVVALALWGVPNNPPAPKKREIPIIVAPPPPPPPPPVKPPDPPPPPEARRPPIIRRAPPPPAQAAKVIAQAPTPDQPLDMTSFTMPEGQGDTYVGGFTSATGTGTTAVFDANTSPHGVPDAKPAPAPAPPDLSKPASPARRDWSCAWPDEAQSSDLRDAKVTIRVSVTSSGDPEKVEIKSSPAPAFADAAQRCALSERYRPALDASGQRASGSTAYFLVHFFR